MTRYERNRPRPQRRVVVTGLGAVSSLGPSAGQLRERLLAGAWQSTRSGDGGRRKSEGMGRR
jgi:hypothetical protein